MNAAATATQPCAGDAPAGASPAGAAPGTALGDRDLLVQVHVLDRVEQGHAVGHGPLERLAPADQARPAGALVDDGGADRLAQVALTRRGAAGVDEARAAEEAVRDLV